MQRTRIGLSIFMRIWIKAIFGLKQRKKAKLDQIFGLNEKKKAKIELI